MSWWNIACQLMIMNDINVQDKPVMLVLGLALRPINCGLGLVLRH